MYCAYTIPGMTGSSLMYYYNGKAVRHTLPSLLSVSFSSRREGLGVRQCNKEREREGGRQRERERERRKKRGERGGVKVKSVAFYAPTRFAAARQSANGLRTLSVRLSGFIFGKTAVLLCFGVNKCARVCNFACVCVCVRVCVCVCACVRETGKVTVAAVKCRGACRRRLDGVS